jgi:2-iminobutanoate/2-iminopropanoate deaminase
MGDWVVTSGQIGTTALGGEAPLQLVEGGTVAELHQALANLASVLAVHGATLGDVVKTTLFLIDMSEFADVNEAWMKHFVDNRPTRSAIAVAALPLGARVEVEAWAYLAPVEKNKGRLAKRWSRSYVVPPPLR